MVVYTDGGVYGFDVYGLVALDSISCQKTTKVWPADASSLGSVHIATKPYTPYPYIYIYYIYIYI